jgi:protein-S-isoprenylcysteine O-methyltransferase Ste14|tara:strand:+ start:596 stop:1195 length:600 start_codon:yes stop_codon:yes gene_type:complete
MNFYQIVLPIFTLSYFLIVFVLRSFILYKQTGVNPLVFTKTDNAHDFIGKSYKLMILFTWFSIAMYSFFPEHYKFIMPIWYLEDDTLKLVSTIVVVLSFLFVLTAQIQMAKSWRIGINYNEKTELVSTGLFNYSRNPVFLGIIISYIGTFLIIPNAISFAAMLITIITIQIQVRMEEEFLEKVHGEDYLDYKKKVRRWI